MARSIKTGPVGDAQPHEAGSGVFVIQMLVHEPIGALAYDFAPHWPHHARLAREAAGRLQAVHAQLVEIPELSGHVRRVPGEMAAAAYEAGTAMVSNVARTIRHLAATIVFEAGGRVSWGRVLDEIRDATGAVNIDSRINSAGHHALAEMITIRDAIEHPQPANMYEASDTGWDKVPLAWILSNRSLAAYQSYVPWLNELTADWAGWLDARPQVPTTMTVQRGTGSRYPMKKAPKR
jgi:hypothetical protein